MKYEIIFKSNRINFVKLTQNLVHDYLNMINDLKYKSLLVIKEKHIVLMKN